MALELAPRGITVNTISPGSTATEMLVEVQAKGDVESMVRGNAAEWRLGVPLGRLADPADQAALAVFLAGEGGATSRARTWRWTAARPRSDVRIRCVYCVCGSRLDDPGDLGDP